MQFNLRSILLQKLSRNTSMYAEGKELSLPIHSGQSGGWGYSSAGVLPPAGYQKVARHVYNYSRLYGRIQIDGPHVEGARTSYAAERRPYDFETDNLVKQMRHGLNFDLFQDGTGIIATPATATSASSFTVADGRGLADGMIVDVLDYSTGVVNGGVAGAEIRYDRTNSTVTLISPATLGDYSDVNSNPTNYRVYRHNSRNDAIMGLKGIVNTANPPGGSLGGIDRTVAANAYWKSNLFSGGGVARRPSLLMIEEARSEVEQVSDGRINLIICGYNVWALLADELVNQKRFTGDKKKLNGWATALMFEDDIPIVRDKHCDPDYMYLLDLNTFELFQNNEGSWMDSDGAILSRVQGRHAYEAAWFRFAQLVCHAPNCNAVITDLDYTIES
jgi:hypothetical protein